jgi:cytochrome oxidase Cu insertion factor (SCO1/SenC/PrrC family)
LYFVYWEIQLNKVINEIPEFQDDGDVKVLFITDDKKDKKLKKMRKWSTEKSKKPSIFEVSHEKP